MWPWEKRFLPDADIGTGVLAPKLALPLTLLGWLGLVTAALVAPFQLPLFSLLSFLLLALILWRLLILDLTYLVLPDVYTLPLTLAGLAATFYLHPHWWWGFAGATLMFAIHYGFAMLCHMLTKGQGGLGGGDIKLATALGAWFGPLAALLILATANLINFIPALIWPKRDIPFGIGLTLAAFLQLGLVFGFYSLYGLPRF
jgi:leader peptidase (prepilin peptidase)/N-methyltransferase